MINIWIYKPNKSLPTEKHIFALVAGPGGIAFTKEHIHNIYQNLKNIGIETILIGDGNNPINDNIIDKLSPYKNYQHMTVMIVAHGYITEANEHILWLGETANTKTKEMILSLTNLRKNKKTDFIITSSYGSVILPQIYKKLPKKSRLTVLAPDETLITGEQLTSIFEILSKEHPSAFSDLDPINAYLCCLKEKMPPQFAIARKGLFKPQEQLLNHIGKPFSINEKITIHQTLGKSLPIERLQELEKTIEKAKTECEIPTKDFGTALAICNVIAENNLNKSLFSRLLMNPKT